MFSLANYQTEMFLTVTYLFQQLIHPFLIYLDCSISLACCWLVLFCVLSGVQVLQQMQTYPLYSASTPVWGSLVHSVCGPAQLDTPGPPACALLLLRLSPLAAVEFRGGLSRVDVFKSFLITLFLPLFLCLKSLFSPCCFPLHRSLSYVFLYIL